MMDPSSDYQFLHDILGKTVKITLKCGTFQGVLQHVDSSRSIFLNRVKNLESGRRVPGVKMFFGHEIVNVELIDDTEQHAAERKTIPTREGPFTKMSAVDKGEPLKQSIQNPAVLSQEIQQLSFGNFRYTFSDQDKGEDIEYVVVDQFQKQFGSAMMHIKKQNVCSIAAEGVNLCRHGKLSWLQVATRSKVFLFDVFLLGARVFKNGLQMILEDQNILKVIHDCRWLSDCLSHQYGIVLCNVFDTQVADVLQFSMETGGFLPHCISTLQDCLMRYLGMPYKCISFMERRRRDVEENPEVWFVRPLPPALLNVLALETAYLLPLRMLLLDEIMSDLTTLVDGYLNAFREGSADPLGSTEISCMELPQELRQLADFHKERRERAIQKYQLNEEGFLVRKQVEPFGTKVAKEEGNQRDTAGLTLSNRAAFPKTFTAGPVHLLDQVAQDNSEEEGKVNHCDNQWATARGSNIESETETRGPVCCKSVLEETEVLGGKLSPVSKPQTKVTLTLEEEIRQLLTEDRNENTKSPAASALSPPKMNNSKISFPAARLPSPAGDLSRQTLYNIALCQNPFFRTIQDYRFQVPTRIKKEDSDLAVHFALPSELDCQLPAPGTGDK
ncbi:piRNA biogenesis protein EXD1 isoform X2 [Rhineura floridana]|uniref:piRNA biogenesis protein EXD1 isoform X2 n=1 Tax=Rhineura floridana TaxID=261503 RepID=UPI002AC82BEB|nr:piRNA biogenesis protein EXD1 isoform X2 [Rhineura floridana]